MPSLVIDNRSVEVPKGTKVISAAEKLGIYIPRFCFHEALGAVGACRMCAVMFLDGPVKGLKMSCMTEAKDGMVISTDHPDAMRFRSWVIECLMLNHPHDCPVCDEGGQCLLQDMTVSGGHGIRRYGGPKRTYRDQDLGPLVGHEMNRCIHCWRCRRFYQDYAGYRDLGAMQIGSRTYFGRQKDGRLQSPFAGNLIDLCPTGVYTDKPSRYEGRRWDYQRSDSVCPHCSLGCATMLNVRYRQVIRLEARPEPAVNGHFICDRGRYGFGFANHPERPRKARIDGSEADLQTALQEAATRLGEVSAEYGAGAVAALGSCRMGLEAQVAMARLCHERGWSAPRFYLEPDLALRVHAAARSLEPELALSQTELQKADFILAVGVDPLAEAPMLALAMRQAVRSGATVALIDPRPLELPFPSRRLAVECGLFDVALPWLVRQAFGAKKRRKLDEIYPRLLTVAGGEGLEKKGLRELKKMARLLAKSQRPALVCGTDMVPQGLPGGAADLVRLLREQGKDAGVFFVLPGANAMGAAMAAPEETAGGDLLEAMERGEVRALLAVESDPLFGFYDRARLERALEGLKLLVVLDHLPSVTAAKAHLLLPVTNLYEAPGISLVNHEGRLQRASAIQEPGTPLDQYGGGGHPPRVFSESTPGGDLLPADVQLEELAGLLSNTNAETPRLNAWEWLAQRQPGAAEAVSNGAPVYGERLLPIQVGQAALVEQPVASPVAVGKLELLVGSWFASAEELSSYRPIPAGPEDEPALWLHSETASRLGLETGGPVRLVLEGGELPLTLRTSDEMNRRTALLTPGKGASWQMLPGRRTLLDESAIQRADRGES